MSEDRLEVALLDLGRHLDVPEPPDVTAAVLARLDEPEPRGHPRLLKVAAVVLVVLIGFGVLITVSPPVRAGVLNLLRFAGIELSSDSAPPGPLPTSVPLPGERSVDLSTAERVSRFPVVVPEALGQPDRVLLIDGEPPRIVSLLYRGGSVRLDEFDGTVDFALYKKLVGTDGVDWVQIRGAGEPAVWIDRPHELVYVDRSGGYRHESARLSGKTLIWQHGDVTMRLEGDLTLEQALEIAASVR